VPNESRPAIRIDTSFAAAKSHYRNTAVDVRVLSAGYGPTKTDFPMPAYRLPSVYDAGDCVKDGGNRYLSSPPGTLRGGATCHASADLEDLRKVRRERTRLGSEPAAACRAATEIRKQTVRYRSGARRLRP